MARRAVVDPRTIWGRRPGDAHRLRTSPRDLVSGTGTGDLLVHAFGRARRGYRHRGFRVGRASRAHVQPPARGRRAMGRDAGRVERGLAKGRGAWREHASVAFPSRCHVTDKERYLATYLAPLPALPRRRSPDAAPPPLAARHCYLAAAPSADQQMSMPQLFTAGVECGHGEARDELKRRVAVVDAELEGFRAVRDRAQLDREALAAQLLTALREQIATQLHIGRIETQLTATQARINELETSTVWRASATLPPS